MTMNRRRRFLLLPLLMALTGFTADDERSWENVGSFVEASTLQPVEALTRRCPAPPEDLCAYGQPLLGETCQVEEVKELGVFGKEQYLAVRYLRQRHFDGAAGQAPFSCSADEIALVALPGGGQARMVWRDGTERSFHFITSVKLFTTPSSERILSLLYCMNGTGGCAQGLLLWTGAAWRRLRRDATWDAVYRDLPAGYRPHKSPEIDLGKLTWEQHLAYEDDANCCPSGRIIFELEIADEKLAVKAYSIIVPEMEATEEAVERLMVAEIGALDPSLSGELFEAWFDGLLPSGTAQFFERTACPEAGEDPEAPAGSRRPDCLALEVEVVSRSRSFRLWFERESLAFLGGKVFSPDLEAVLELPALAALPALLKKTLRYRPLACPPATQLHLHEEYAGLYEWCEDATGRKQGPYRSWFSTGRYLMARGRYEDDGKIGEWIECNRFETCAFETYARKVAP